MLVALLLLALPTACSDDDLESDPTFRPGTAQPNPPPPVTPPAPPPPPADTTVVYSSVLAKARLSELAARMESNLGRVPLDSTRIPRSGGADGRMRTVRSNDWTSGFFPGILWQLASTSGSAPLKRAAQDWSAFIVKEQYDGSTHDTGFKIFCSLGSGYKLMDQTQYADEIERTAQTLIGRFNPTVGTIRSWNFGRWAYPTIIDNMMNLELLFEASLLVKDSVFYKIADRHARTTLAHHFRADASSYHVVDYDPGTGAVRSQGTFQGLSDASAWSRGQAWGLYGYTMSYRYTRNPAYLEQARRIAAFFFEHPNTPVDRIPYWDFDAAPGAATPRDASAAAIAASAVLELLTYDPANRERYLAWVDAILRTLETDEYQASMVPFILTHSTGHLPEASEIDVAINYADYYYVEALRRRSVTADE